ncbi:LIM-domain binding protein-domain-containing protein [Lipomyces chichibuensis]|uniref:LIM-domain binding protein-domain-containing protein n=1 Tax=Lipomyces chichibuensis TaxID=1546026 RepID=UPI003343DC76
MASPQPQTAPTPQSGAPTPVSMQPSQSKLGQYSTADASLLSQQQQHQQQQQQMFQHQLQQQQQHDLTAAQQQYLLQRQQQQQQMYQLQLLRQRQQMMNGVTPAPNGPQQPGMAQPQIPVSQVGIPANAVGVNVPGAPGQLQHLPQNSMAAAAAAYQFQSPSAATIANIRMANPNIPQHILQQQIQHVLASQQQQQLLQQQLQQQQHGPQGQGPQPTPQQQHAQAQMHAQTQQQGHPPGSGGQQLQQQQLPIQSQLQQQGVAQPVTQQQILQQQQQGLQPGQQGQQQTQQGQQQLVAAAGIPANLAAMQTAGIRGKLTGITALTRFLTFCETLSSGIEQQRDLDYWRKFVTDFYSDLASMKYTVVNAVDKVAKHYEVPTAALPRYYYTLFQDGVRRVQIFPENPREVVINQDVYAIECGRATVIYWFSNGNHVISHGSLRVYINTSARIESLEFQSHDHNEFVSRAMAVAAASAATAPGGGSPTSNTAASVVSRSQVNGYGITDALTRFLQITQVMAQMRELVPYYLTPSNSSGPLQSFNTFVSLINTHREQFQQQQLQQQAAQQQQINQIQQQQQLQLQQAHQQQMQLQLQMQMQQQAHNPNMFDDHKDGESKNKKDSNLNRTSSFDWNDDSNLGAEDEMKFSMDNGNDSNSGDLSIDAVSRSVMENGPSAGTGSSISSATTQAVLHGDTSSPMMNTPSPSQPSSGVPSPRTAANKRRRESNLNSNNNSNSTLSQSSTINVDNHGNGSELSIKEEDGEPSKTRSPPKVKQSPKITKQISNKRVKTLNGGG